MNVKIDYFNIFCLVSCSRILYHMEEILRGRMRNATHGAVHLSRHMTGWEWESQSCVDNSIIALCNQATFKTGLPEQSGHAQCARWPCQNKLA